MTEQELKEIKGRADKATKGPWKWVCGWLKNQEGEVRGNQSANDLFIAHARQDVPALCEEVRRLKGWGEEFIADGEIKCGDAVIAISAVRLERLKELRKRGTDLYLAIKYGSFDREVLKTPYGDIMVIVSAFGKALDAYWEKDSAEEK